MARLDPRGRKIKILATLGPASRSPEMITKLLQAGADAFRVNMSHGDHATHAETIAAIRAAEKSFGRPIAVLCDLQGPKLRVGEFKDGKALIRHGSHFTLDRNPEPGDETRVCLPHPELFGVLTKGQRLLIDDGKLRLRVISDDDDKILCSAEVGGVIMDRKGVNVPDAVVPVPAMTEKDRRDLAFAVEHGADWVALSFVQRPEDVAEARRLMGGYGALIAKIEKPAAIEHLEAIIELADGIMVARGDLGVELNPEEVPPLQKRIVEATRRSGKPVIVATQMLESMIENPAPTRAEVSDVANAVYDGADAVMLSAGDGFGCLASRGGDHHAPHRHAGRKRSRLSRSGPFHASDARCDHCRCARPGQRADCRDCGDFGDHRLHRLGFDRAAGGARAARCADAGADAEPHHVAADRAAVGRCPGGDARHRQL